jgi:hypothetical protein
LFATIDCPDCEPCDCEECFSGNNNQGKCHHVSLVPLKVLSLVAFLVEDACVGVFMNSCLKLARSYAKSFV